MALQLRTKRIAKSLTAVSFYIWFLSIPVDLFGQSSAVDPEGLVYSLGDDPSLALPEHPGRKPPNPDYTIPKQSQPGRDSLRTNSNPTFFRNADKVIPGRPSRNLEPPSSIEDAKSIEFYERETKEEVEPILWVLPRELRGGGLTFECIYTGETFTKAKGGIRPGRPTNYRSNLDLVAIADTGKLGWWDRGRLFVYGQNLSGRPLSESEVGDIQLFSNLDSTIGPGQRPHFTAISEYWYDQFFVDDLISFRIGKQDTNAIFAFSDLGGEFVHSSFGAPPIIPMPTFPSNALGLSMFFKLLDTTTLGFGVYDGTLANGPQGVRWGFDTLGHNGAYSIGQLEFKPQLGEDGELPTTLRVGMWHHSDDTVWTPFTTAPDPLAFSQNYGFFLTADQMLWKENGTEDDQGLGVFVQYFSAPSDRNVISDYVGGGVVIKGFLPRRDNDYLGVGVAKSIFSQDFRDVEAAGGSFVGNSETAVETFYKWMVCPNFSLQPDFQYIAKPSGLYSDAIVAGLRFECVF
jgi:porin